MIDLPLAGGPSTWSNNHTWTHLDRFLISPEWESHFSDVWQKRLARLASDHWPILLDCGGIKSGRWYFKFENMWLKSENFVERVKQWWISYQFEGIPSFIFENKLKALKRYLKEWNIQSFGNVKENKNTKWMEIQVLERLQEGRILTEEEQAQKILLVADLKRIILQEEMSWRQKSRALWLKEGDRSTRFFHSIANSHRRNNNIEVLKIERVECREEEAIKDHEVDFFEKILTEQVE
ncbi:hypothetical protein F2P56_013156 [Juglans regia]|uniref:Uncharacterized protein LOC108997920 n=2 Tax=Juglans regia TaxID=51240 RepID=A0A2I4FDY4_JUGRE|nr:uncharacterized protein LOC108997920 [Juglans regia]KAF5469056.1 hypothetical protein F2P56_013156 [Juglans regia]